MQAYLSIEHLAGIETACPVSALGSEMPRQTPEVRRAATLRIQEMIDLVARQYPDWGRPGTHERALATVATVGGNSPGDRQSVPVRGHQRGPGLRGEWARQGQSGHQGSLSSR